MRGEVIEGIFIGFLFLGFMSVSLAKDEEFQCYMCSYSVWDKTGSLHDCITHPNLLGEQSHLKCGNFCVFSEHYEKYKKMVVSYFRSCSTDWGNSCVEDASAISCKGSCKGNFCNENEVGQRYKEYLAQHRDNDYTEYNNDYDDANSMSANFLLILSSSLYLIYFK